MSKIRIKQIQDITSTSPAAGHGLQYDTGTGKYVNGPVNATTVTITDNESTSETNSIIFTAGGDIDGGNLRLESDGDLTYNPNTGTLSVTNINVSGTTTTNNVETLTTSSGVIFEGSVDDGNELTLLAGTVTIDRTISLPDASGTVALISDLAVIGDGGLTTNDFTNADHDKLNALETDKNYVHTQSSLATSWVVSHNLGKYVSVTVVDSAGTVVVGQVDYDSLNQVTLLFKATFSGKAYFN